MRLFSVKYKSRFFSTASCFSNPEIASFAVSIRSSPAFSTSIRCVWLVTTPNTATHVTMHNKSSIIQIVSNSESLRFFPFSFIHTPSLPVCWKNYSIPIP